MNNEGREQLAKVLDHVSGKMNLIEIRGQAKRHIERKHGHTADAEQIAIRLWTFVHGASSLQLDGDYERVAPGLDVYNLIADVTPMLLGVSRENRTSARGKNR